MRSRRSHVRSATVVAIAIAAACSASHPEVGNRRRAPSGSLVEQARAFERGIGVARDYRAAAEAYRTACKDGGGDVAACGALIRARLRARGADFDRLAIQAFAGKVCLDRRDPFSCVAADLLSEGESTLAEPLLTTIKDVVAHLQPCDAAHLSECHARHLAGALDFSDGSTAVARRAAFRYQLCTLDIIDGCVELLARASHTDPERIADVRRRLQAACDARDADACFEAPERTAIPPKELCAAHDYEACGTLGCLGDEEAAKLAAGHGVDSAACARLERPSRSAREANGRQAAAKITELKNRLCACRDRACADKVQTDLTAWSVEAARLSNDSGTEYAADLEKQLEATTEELGACMARLSGP